MKDATRYRTEDKAQADEVSRWLTFRRLGESEIIKFTMFDNREFWRGDFDRAGKFVFGIVRRFCCGDCYGLAVAAALNGGAPVLAIYRGWTGLIAHALSFDPATQTSADILGRQPVRDAVADMRGAVGNVRLKVERPDESALSSDDDAEVLREVAAALPWLPRTGKATPFARLVEVLEEDKKRGGRAWS